VQLSKEETGLVGGLWGRHFFIAALIMTNGNIPLAATIADRSSGGQTTEVQPALGQRSMLPP